MFLPKEPITKFDESLELTNQGDILQDFAKRLEYPIDDMFRTHAQRETMKSWVRGFFTTEEVAAIRVVTYYSAIDVKELILKEFESTYPEVDKLRYKGINPQNNLITRVTKNLTFNENDIRKLCNFRGRIFECFPEPSKDSFPEHVKALYLLSNGWRPTSKYPHPDLEISYEPIGRINKVDHRCGSLVRATKAIFGTYDNWIPRMTLLSSYMRHAGLLEEFPELLSPIEF